MSPDAWPVPTCCPRRKGGSFRCPRRASQRAHFVLHDRRRMIMRVFSRRLPALAAATVLAAACAACGSSQATTSSSASPPRAAARPPGSFPATVTAANGTVQLSSRPKAIISLSPTATEMLYAIGAGGQVKAVDDNSDYPPQAPRTKLSAFEPNVEAIVAYKPDLVVVSADTAGADQAVRRVQDPGPGTAGRGQARRRVHPVRRAWPGHRPSRPG